MSTHALGRDARNRVGLRIRVSTHWAWLGGGFVLAFVVPFLLADRHAVFGVVFEVNRDLFYGVYALVVAGLFALWSRSTGYDLVAAVKRRWPAALRSRPGGRRCRPGSVGRAYGGLRPRVRMGLELDRCPRVARDPLRSHGWTTPVRVSNPRRLRGVRRRPGLNRRFAGKVVIGIVALFASLRDDSRLSLRLQRLPLRQGCEAADG